MQNYKILFDTKIFSIGIIKISIYITDKNATFASLSTITDKNR